MEGEVTGRVHIPLSYRQGGGVSPQHLQIPLSPAFPLVRYRLHNKHQKHHLQLACSRAEASYLEEEGYTVHNIIPNNAHQYSLHVISTLSHLMPTTTAANSSSSTPYNAHHCLSSSSTPSNAHHCLSPQPYLMPTTAYLYPQPHLMPTTAYLLPQPHLMPTTAYSSSSCCSLPRCSLCSACGS